MKAALELVHAGEPPAEEPEQLDLIGAEKPEEFAKRVAVGPGRPPGARNKRTREWAEYLLSRYESPLEVLAQIAVARVDTLKQQLSCTRLEALQEKRLAAIALIPYLHQKQPLAVDVSKTSYVNLVITDATHGDDDLGLTATVIEAVARDNSES